MIDYCITVQAVTHVVYKDMALHTFYMVLLE